MYMYVRVASSIAPTHVVDLRMRIIYIVMSYDDNVGGAGPAVQKKKEGHEA